MAGFPRAGAVLVGLMTLVDHRLAHGRWSARRTLGFIVVTSLLLWSLLISAAVWIAGALLHAPR